MENSRELLKPLKGTFCPSVRVRPSTKVGMLLETDFNFEATSKTLALSKEVQYRLFNMWVNKYASLRHNMLNIK